MNAATAEKLPVIDVADRKGTGVVPVQGVILNNDAELRGFAAQAANESRTLTPAEQFDAWLAAQKSKHVPAITDQDYLDQAARLQIDPVWLRVVFKIESAGSGFNPDGSTKCLFERHVLRREVKKAGLDTKAVSKRLGGNLYAMRAGGYKGGIAEWWRIREATIGLTEVTGQFDQSLELALRSGSHGKPQIMGLNQRLAGYDSAKAMVEAFAQDGDNHLEAFCQFVENTGLVQHLQAASQAADPYPHILKFAKGYNGSRCCEKGTKRKNYAAEMMAEWRKLTDQPTEFKPMWKSRTQLGNLASGLGKALGLGAGTQMISDPVAVLEAAKSMKDKLSGAITEADQLREQIAGFAEKSAELTEKAANYEMWLGLLVMGLVISVAGHGWSWWARWDDRRRGWK